MVALLTMVRRSPSRTSRPPGQRVRQLDRALADLEAGSLRKEKVSTLLGDYRSLLRLLQGLGRGLW